MSRQSPPPFYEKEKNPQTAQVGSDAANLWWTFNGHNARSRA